MEWMERWNQALQYLEAHLTEGFDERRLAQIACCSPYHFQRVFACLAGVPLGEYLRRRRMSRAAEDLQRGGERVLDVALKYGYASPTAFNRAFRSVHGVAPSQAREPGVRLKSFPPISFRITVQGVEEMNYRIETKPAFRIVGIAATLKTDLEQNFAEVPGLWQKAAAEGLMPQLAAKMDSEPMGVLGVSITETAQTWRYWIAVSSTQPAQAPFEETVVPAGTWAIFSGEGTGVSIQELERRAVTEWLPTSGYEYADAPDVEVYLSDDMEHARYEVWLPIRKK